MKKHLRYTVSIFACLLICAPVFSQNTKTDSIEVYLKTAKEDTTKVNTLNTFCRDLWQQGEFGKALTYAQSALDISKKLFFKKGIANSHNTIGVTYWYQGSYAKALVSHLAALKIKEELLELAKAKGDSSEVKERKNSIARSLNNIGIVYDAQLNFSKALDYYGQVLKIQEELGDKKGVASDLNNIGNTYHAEKNNTKAIDYFLRCLKIMKEIGNKMGIESSLSNLGNSYRLEHNYSKALEYNLQCLVIAKEINDKNGIMISLNNLGLVNTELGQYDKALDFLNNGLAAAKEMNSKEWLKISYESLSDLYERTKHPDKALDFYKLFSDMKDTLLNEDNNKNIAQVQAQFDSDKKDSEIKLLNKDKTLKEVEFQKQKAEAEKQQTQRNGFIIGFVLVLLLAVFIFKNYREKHKANLEISHQKEIIEEHQKEIIDSINYAKRIQYALLASESLLKKHLPEHFVLFKPKDIVSGDFYWATEYNNNFYLAICDSTGHGVPGAFMSILNIGFLSEAIKEKDIVQPNEILNYVRSRLIETISKEGQKDGMDAILIRMNVSPFEGDRGMEINISYAAANNEPILLRDGMITELPKDKMPVGKGEKTAEFTNHTITLKKGDSLILYTDGYADQFGGEKGKKFKYKPLNELLLSNREKPSTEQKELLNQKFEDWRGNLEQVDDVLIIGVRI